MIIGVGVGSTVEHAIYSSIKMNNPNFVAFLVTAQSQSTLDRPVEGSHLVDVCECEKFIVDDHEDLDKAFVTAEEAVGFLFHKGYKPSEIVADITSGTKVISAAICSLAILYNLYSVTYVGGTIRSDGGIVVKGSEKPRELKPLRIYYRHQLNKIRDYFSKYQFQTCLDIINEIKAGLIVLDKDERLMVEELGKMVMGFIHWERFDHKGAAEQFKGAKFFDANNCNEYLEKLLTDKKRMAARFPKQQGNVPSIYLIIDVFQNAKRRALSGNFDDAVARLYRCIEMIGQYCLLEHGIITSDVDIEILKGRVNQATIDKLSAKRNGNKIQIGLVEDFQILSELDNKNLLSENFRKNQETLEKYLRYRNDSILAHGIKPLTGQQYEEMETLCKVFLGSLVPDVEDTIAEIDSCFKFDLTVGKIFDN
jgi:CRISPR-associated protein (TIGR02710 family)